MALPLNGLYPALVANYLEIVTTNYGQLHLLNPNKHGYNCPDPSLQSQFWGVKNPYPWFAIGAFKNFDKYWRCYTLGNIEIGGDLNLYNAGFLGFNVYATYGLTEAPAFQTVPHVFDIWMNRWDINWNPSYGAVLIAEDFTIYEDGRKKIDIDPLNPPDGFGPLPYNHPIYFSIRHKSSPERRWDSSWFEAVPPIGGTGTIVKDPDGNYDGWTITIDINEPI